MDTELVKGTLSLLILSLLARRAMYGYEIAATVHERSNGAFVWKEGSLYPALHKLEADGCVTSKWEVADGAEGGEGGRRRRYYHITDLGRAVLGRKVADWNVLARAVNEILEARHEQARAVS